MCVLQGKAGWPRPKAWPASPHGQAGHLVSGPPNNQTAPCLPDCCREVFLGHLYVLYTRLQSDQAHTGCLWMLNEASWLQCGEASLLPTRDHKQWCEWALWPCGLSFRCSLMPLGGGVSLWLWAAARPCEQGHPLSAKHQPVSTAESARVTKRLALRGPELGALSVGATTAA